ncbi:MAG: cysteine protease StiP family protein [Lachnospiraceae bacterium]|nr:cysteine protease StiP family protein [Lachnospiraceae bacterium]
MRSSYLPEDVVLLLKDITGLVQPQPTEEREKLIQSGRHYSEMLPVEYVPTEKYMEVYREALGRYAKQVADAVGVLADKIIAARGKDVVLVSLARAGTPIGILIRRFIKGRYGVDVPHYSISIIRGRGIDDNAMKYLLEIYKPEQLLFVDGWIGKGAILSELEKDVKAYPHVSPEIAVVADPAGVTELCGTHEDILIPSSCLNSTVSGLVSRTFLREDIIGEKDFHGAVFYEELRASDLSYEFIETIEKYFIPKEGNTCGQQEPVGAIREETGENQGVSGMPGEKPDETQGVSGMPGQESVKVREVSGGKGIDEVRKIAAFFGIEDINFVKPGIGETTRVLLRRVPWKVLIDERYRGAPELSHVVRLAEEKSVPVEYYPMAHYKCCGIIKKIADA